MVGLGLILRLAPYAAALALAGGVWWHGYATGRDRAEARHERAVAALEARLSTVTRNAAIAEAARLRAERERNELLADLDTEGDAADGADRVALPAGSVSRINAIGAR